MSSLSDFDSAYMMASLGFRRCILRRPVNQKTVLWAIRASESILKHDISPSMRQAISEVASHAQKWMETGDASPAEHSTISNFITQVDTYFTICHPEIHMIEKVSRIARKAAQLTDKNPSLSHLYSMLFEYMDVMVPISRILKCTECFGPDAYSASLPIKDDSMFWIRVKQGLLFNESTRQWLPLNYIPLGNHQISDEPTIKDCRRIRAWLLRACYIVGWDIKDIEWQIINYSTFLETPCGPRMLFRTGRWSHLAMHTVRTRKHLSLLNYTSGSFQGFVEIGPYASRIIDLVEKKWFSSLSDTGECEFSDAVLSMDTAWQKEDKSTTAMCKNFRQMQLFDHSQLIITEPLMRSCPFGYGTKNESLRKLIKDDESDEDEAMLN
ncbi:hypothetical protein MGYG_03912 [Nannizzia gypsea CBS 118893]|uniref:Uncharacterized protein n=1 Tax=Arthroderma gypseum (strain ATCC MYA-4604 / CBS 118893) TaxID=535722 RepID=E4UUE2_ARTGP|nr:hypothetical protein MGYG_03912 [Nannizzia gypsea CBS 118893]EFR00909.1 hypothetical protein MGYG_03912 [Nannizzia gypsea CBS 118893]